VGGAGGGRKEGEERLGKDGPGDDKEEGGRVLWLLR
jgi:hypothetical protein